MILWVYTVLLIFTFVNILIPISGTVTVTPLLALLTDPHSAIGLASFYFAIGSTIRAIKTRLAFIRDLFPALRTPSWFL